MVAATLRHTLATANPLAGVVIAFSPFAHAGLPECADEIGSLARRFALAFTTNGKQLRVGNGGCHWEGGVVKPGHPAADKPGIAGEDRLPRLSNSRGSAFRADSASR